MGSVAPEIFVPDKSLIMVGATINTAPVSVSSVEATASKTLSITPGDYLPLWQPMP
jgi:hypothetical protein